MSITFEEELLMAEEKTKQDKKGRLLALRDYLYKFTDEQHPVSTQELIDEMTVNAVFILYVSAVQKM